MKTTIGHLAIPAVNEFPEQTSRADHPLDLDLKGTQGAEVGMVTSLGPLWSLTFVTQVHIDINILVE